MQIITPVMNGSEMDLLSLVVIAAGAAMFLIAVGQRVRREWMRYRTRRWLRRLLAGLR